MRREWKTFAGIGLLAFGVCLLSWLTLPLLRNNLANVQANSIMQTLPIEKFDTPSGYCAWSNQLARIADNRCDGDVGCGAPDILKYASLSAVNTQVSGQDELISSYVEGWRKWCAGDMPDAMARWQNHGAVIGKRFSQFGGRAFQKDDFKTAVEWFEMAVALRPQDAHGFLALGDAYLRANSTAPAESAYLRAAQLDPHEPRAFAGAAIAAYTLGNFERSEQFIQKAIQLAPNNSEYWKIYGGLLLNFRENPADAEYWFRKVIAADPNDDRAHSALAVALIRQGKSEEANKFLERSVQLSGVPQRQAEYYYFYGVTLAVLNQPREAARYYEQALAKDPSNLDYATALSLLYAQLQDCSRAHVLYLRYALKDHFTAAQSRDFARCAEGFK